MALALALARALGPDIAIALVDPALGRMAAEPDDPRASALAAGSQRMLAALGVWPAIAAEAEPVRRIEITDSSLEAGVRPVLLTYDNALDDGAWASFIVPNAVLLRELAAALGQHGTIVPLATAAVGCAVDGAGASVRLADGSLIAARLVVAGAARRCARRPASRSSAGIIRRLAS